MEKKTPKLLHQAQSYIIINKPAGMIVNNADTSKAVYTVQDYVLENFELEKADPGSEFAKRGGIVHRLDKETSGVLIIALSEASFVAIQQQFKNREVSKEYVALCHGKLPEEGQINAPIGRLPWNRMRFGVIPSGREAYTEFKLIDVKQFVEGKKKEELSLIRVFPKTGRTHQIRVHMQYSGHPIFADCLYAGRKTYASDKKYLDRHFLHAAKIQFTDPDNSLPVTFEAPLTPDLVAFLAQLA